MANEFINSNLISLDLMSDTKEELFCELAVLLEKGGYLSNRQLFLQDLRAREEISNTGFEDGVAFPHAKSSAVVNPGFALGISRKGIDYGIGDGQLYHLFFMIASPEGSSDHHVQLLAKISNKLLENGFIDKLMVATDNDAAMKLLISDGVQEIPQQSTPKS